MAEIETCERYGQKDCCSALILPYLVHVKKFTVELQYLNGRRFRIHPWEISMILDLGDYWIVGRQNTPEYSAIDPATLMKRSRIKYARHHHWDRIKLAKKGNCPLR